MYNIILNDVIIDRVKFLPTSKGYKTSVSRRKLNLCDFIIDEFKYELYGNCVFCDGRYKRNFDIIFNIQRNNCYILGVELSKYHYSETKNMPKIELKRCNLKECNGYNLNPNSIEYVTKIYNVDSNDAKNIIHTRNSSPFYEYNHDSIESYNKYQGILGRVSEETKINMIKKQNYSRSLEGYIERFGEKMGTEKWHIMNKNKAITLETRIKLFGEQIGIEKYKHWKNLIVPSLENRIRKYGNGLGEYKWQNECKQGSKFGYKYRTFETNNLLRSRHEYNFYIALRKFGFDDYDLEFEKLYSNDGIDLRRSDFYIKKFDCYIEVAGMMNVDWYNEKMMDKIKDFSPYVVYPNSDYIETVYNIILNEEKEAECL